MDIRNDLQKSTVYGRTKWVFDPILTNDPKSISDWLFMFDNGHGKETAGKRSPVWSDGSQLFEYEFNRAIVSRVLKKLKATGVKCHELVPEITDVSLPERCRRANNLYKQFNKKAVLISVHANAGGGTGWECYTTVGNTPADPLATILCEEAKKVLGQFPMRFDWSDGDPDKESQFYILKHTSCPSILTENLFMDTEKDCRYLMSEEGRDVIADLHVKSILRMIDIL